MRCWKILTSNRPTPQKRVAEKPISKRKSRLNMKAAMLAVPINEEPRSKRLVSEMILKSFFQLLMPVSLNKLIQYLCMKIEKV